MTIEDKINLIAVLNNTLIANEKIGTNKMLRDHTVELLNKLVSSLNDAC